MTRPYNVSRSHATIARAMTLATVLGVFFYPLLFVFIGKVARYEQKREHLNKAE